MQPGPIVLLGRSTSITMFSLATRAFSRLSSSLSRTRSCSHNSVITTGSTTTSEGAMKWTMGRNQRRGEGADPGEQHHRVGTYLNANDARLGETSILAR
jgi:hypothetical protein